MGYIRIDGGGYSDWNGSPALNLIISDYSSDIVRCFGYVDGESSASWAFDTEGYYDSLYSGCSKVITRRGNGSSFSAGSTYKIEVKAYYKDGGSYYVSAWSNTIYVTIPKPRAPKPYWVTADQDYNSVWCDYGYDTYYDAYVIYNINGNGWRGVGDYISKSDLNNGDRVEFAVRCERRGYEPSDYRYSGVLTVKKRPSYFSGFNCYAGKTMDYTWVNDYTLHAYICGSNDWNNFMRNLNEVRRYKGYSSKSFTYASRNTTFTASIYNEAVNAIQDMSNNTGLHHAWANSTEVTAEHFLSLKRALNNID